MTTDDPNLITLYFHGSIPIPVGHRVEVVETYTGRLLSDLETGITYGKITHFMEWESKSSSELRRPPTTPLPGNERARWSGRVLVCQVLEINSEIFQTTLVVHRHPPVTAPYR